MLVYNVELIVLWAFQASSVCFLSLSCLSLYVTGFSVIMQQAITDPSLLHSCCFQYFNSAPQPHPFFNSQNVKMATLSAEVQFLFNSPSIVLTHRPIQEKSNPFCAELTVILRASLKTQVLFKVTYSAARLTSLPVSVCLGNLARTPAQCPRTHGTRCTCQQRDSRQPRRTPATLVARDHVTATWELLASMPVSS